MTIDESKCTTNSETTQNGLNRKGVDWLLLLVQDYSFLSSRMGKRQNFKKVDGQKFSLPPHFYLLFFLLPTCFAFVPCVSFNGHH